MAVDLVHAVEFEVEQLADAKPNSPGEQQRVGCKPVVGYLECSGEAAIGVDGHIARQRSWLAGMVGAEDELAGRGVIPSHSVISASMWPTAWMRRSWSATVIGFPVLAETALATEFK